jgi:hypothetical protein
MIAFPLGRKMMTRGINDAIADDAPFAMEIILALERHAAADFREMTEDDQAANERAVEQGDERVFSAYETARGRVWIITEADRSATTILFPEEY